MTDEMMVLIFLAFASGVSCAGIIIAILIEDENK